METAQQSLYSKKWFDTALQLTMRSIQSKPFRRGFGDYLAIWGKWIGSPVHPPRAVVRSSVLLYLGVGDANIFLLTTASPCHLVQSCLQCCWDQSLHCSPSSAFQLSKGLLLYPLLIPLSMAWMCLNTKNLTNNAVSTCCSFGLWFCVKCSLLASIFHSPGKRDTRTNGGLIPEEVS